MAHPMFATGVGAPEGPVSLPDGTMYVTEMSAATSCVTKLDQHGQRTVVKKTGGRPNGLAMDGDGLLHDGYGHGGGRLHQRPGVRAELP